MIKAPNRYRVERLAEQIRAEVAEIVAGELKDPRIGLANVTRVELTADLHHARVLVSVLGDEEAREKTLQGLASAAGYVGHEIGRRLRMRRDPEVLFVFDRGAEAGEKIEGLLQRVPRQE